jgi:serine/threonine protein kinase
MNKPLPLQTVGPYEILARLGHGGMGTVFKARHQTTNDIVAVKVASQHVAQHPTLRTRFRTEYVVASRLSHPNLVRALDHGEEDGAPYLVMEFVPGEGLDQRLKNGPLTEAKAVPLFLQVAQALQFLHRNMIVHRDIKPGNILLTDTGVAKVGDFGLGKDLDADSVLTHSHMGLGTLEFAAPEQCDDARSVDLRCDLYSLAVTMYLALAGKHPFGKTTNLYHLLKKKMGNEFTPLRQFLPTVTPALEQLISQALHADADQRPADCAAFLTVLQAMAGPAAAAAAVDFPPLPPAVNKRASVRFVTTLPSSCLTLTNTGESWKATVMDVSAQGVCLQMERRFEPKTTLQLALTLGAAESLHTFVIQTRWVKPCSERSWLIGCTFLTPLTNQELEVMLISGTEQTRHEGLV